MTPGQIAAFRFNDFKVLKLLYNTPTDEDEVVEIGFSPSGAYYPNKGIFELTLKFVASSGTSKYVIVECTSLATFVFPENPKFEDIPDYFYKNAIAIFFPYLRAFVSTVTLQANSRLVVLGVMNLTNLEKPFKESTSCVLE